MGSLEVLFGVASVGVVGSVIFSRMPYYLVSKGYSVDRIIYKITILQAAFMAIAIAPAFLIVAALFGILGVAGFILLTFIFFSQYLLPPYLLSYRLYRYQIAILS